MYAKLIWAVAAAALLWLVFRAGRASAPARVDPRYVPRAGGGAVPYSTGNNPTKNPNTGAVDDGAISMPPPVYTPPPRPAILGSGAFYGPDGSVASSSATYTVPPPPPRPRGPETRV